MSKEQASQHFSDYIMNRVNIRVLEELRNFAKKLQNHPDIIIHPDAVRAITDEYDNSKDALLPCGNKDRYHRNGRHF